jgi:small subunit ribosomal protein S4
VKTRDRSMKLARESLQKNIVRIPDFLELSGGADQPEGRVTRMPNRQDVDERITDIREQLIIEIATR